MKKNEELTNAIKSLIGFCDIRFGNQDEIYNEIRGKCMKLIESKNEIANGVTVCLIGKNEIGQIIEKSESGFGHFLVKWQSGAITREYGMDLEIVK